MQRSKQIKIAAVISLFLADTTAGIAGFSPDKGKGAQLFFGCAAALLATTAYAFYVKQQKDKRLPKTSACSTATRNCFTLTNSILGTLATVGVIIIAATGGTKSSVHTGARLLRGLMTDDDVNPTADDDLNPTGDDDVIGVDDDPNPTTDDDIVPPMPDPAAQISADFLQLAIGLMVVHLIAAIATFVADKCTQDATVPTDFTPVDSGSEDDEEEARHSLRRAQ